MEELKIARVYTHPHVFVYPHIYTHPYHSNLSKNETNTIQETRELTEQEQKIVNAGGFIATIIIIVSFIVFIIKLLKEV